jgi:uncharacterized protein YkwD
VSINTGLIVAFSSSVFYKFSMKKLLILVLGAVIFVHAHSAPPGKILPLGDFKLSCEEARFVGLLNLYRLKNGLSPIVVSKSGVESTRWHAQDMIQKNYFSHTEPSGRNFFERAGVFKFPAWSENIAAGSSSAEKTFCQWKTSPGHNINMLKARHVSAGIGHVQGGPYRSYWSNNFGPKVEDVLLPPLSEDSSCEKPQSLPSC